MKARKTASCPVCKGTRRRGTTTFTADLGFGVVVVRNVPAHRLLAVRRGLDRGSGSQAH